MKQNETKGFLRAGGHVLRQPSEVGRHRAHCGDQRGAVPATLPGGARLLAFHLLAGSWDGTFSTNASDIIRYLHGILKATLYITWAGMGLV